MIDDAFPEKGCFGHLKLLLVEDNVINQEVTIEMLAHTGARINVAANGREAVEAVGRTRYDAILMDVQMPGMDGCDAARSIRRIEPAGDPIPIIAMTAGAMEGDRQKCLDAGMNDFIAKPIQPRALFSRLEKWLLDSETRVVGDREKAAAGPAPSPAVPQPPYPGIDLDAAMKRMVGNRALLERLLGEFYRNYGDGGAPLFSEAGRAAIRDGDGGAALDYLHTLKGVAGNLSARDLHDACQDLETAVRAGETDGADGRLSRLEKALAEILATARPYRDRRKETRRDKKCISGDPETAAGVEALMETMAAYLEKNSLKAEECLDRLKNRLADGPGLDPEASAELQTLSEQVEAFAFRDARETLGRLTAKIESGRPG
jgi:two-component system, sensor histidine kinase and response regulator